MKENKEEVISDNIKEQLSIPQFIIFFMSILFYMWTFYFYYVFGIVGIFLGLDFLMILIIFYVTKNKKNRIPSITKALILTASSKTILIFVGLGGMGSINL